MTRPSTPPILSELRSSSSPAGQVAALRALKNEIIGHEQKKEMWIGLGILDPLVRILHSHKGSGKKRYREIPGPENSPKRRGNRTDEEEARLQAIIILGSLAHGEWNGGNGECVRNTYILASTGLTVQYKTYRGPCLHLSPERWPCHCSSSCSLVAHRVSPRCNSCNVKDTEFSRRLAFSGASSVGRE